MAMTRITPMQVDVRTRWRDGSPRQIRLGEERLEVVGVDRVRSESRAHPADAEPRTLYEVRTPDARYALTYEHRSRRWTVEGLDPEPMRNAA